jgi:hypothetical protein
LEITTRSLWTLIHGMGFGALYLLAGTGAIYALYQSFHPAQNTPASIQQSGRLLGIYLSVMAALAWLTVLTGTYIIYPWYRTPVPAGEHNLSAYPRALILSSPSTSAWHSIGMEWKEHVAWLVPIAITMAAVVVLRYRRDLVRNPQLRIGLQAFVLTSLLAAGIAGFFGAMLDKAAPVEGGATIHLISGGQQ